MANEVVNKQMPIATFEGLSITFEALMHISYNTGLLALLVLKKCTKVICKLVGFLKLLFFVCWCVRACVCVH